MENDGNILLSLETESYTVYSKKESSKMRSLSTYTDFLQLIEDHLNKSEMYLLTIVLCHTPELIFHKDDYFCALYEIFEKLLDNKETLPILEKYFNVKRKQGEPI